MLTESGDRTVPAAEAIVRLNEGNARYVARAGSYEPPTGRERRALVAAQYPFAIILSCSDSRVPSELVFDQGLGDLFVIRVAGNIVAPSLVGSVEFAAAAFGTRLVVVMGHTRCGAIRATLEGLQGGAGAATENIRDILDRCRAPVETVLAAAGPNASPEWLMREAVRANVRHSCDHLRHGSRLLERLCHDEGMLIVGAEYSLETGVVDFFHV